MITEAATKAATEAATKAAKEAVAAASPAAGEFLNLSLDFVLHQRVVSSTWSLTPYELLSGRILETIFIIYNGIMSLSMSGGETISFREDCLWLLRTSFETFFPVPIQRRPLTSHSPPSRVCSASDNGFSKIKPCSVTPAYRSEDLGEEMPLLSHIRERVTHQKTVTAIHN
jgi:hypothetical protein